MLELFVVGTFWFWALIALEVVLLFSFVEYENGSGATVSLVIFACCLQWLGNVDIIGYIVSNPLQTLILVGSYFLLGAIWGTIKWWIFCHDRLEEYNDLKQEFFQKNGVPAGTKVVPAELKAEWRGLLERHTAYNRGGGKLSDAPSAKKNKSRIMRWMSFWPFSMVWSFINDFVKRVFRSIYQKIAGYLQHISDSMFGKIQDDLE